MKKMILTASLIVMNLCAVAQKQVTIKAGSIVPMQSVNSVKAADVNEGDLVDFQVIQDINVDGVCAIPRGTLVKGKVTEAKKSSLAGTKGRLSITIDRLNLTSGDPVFFSGTNVHIYGKNKTPLAVVTGCLIWPCLFIPGTRAEMPAGYEVHATVAANATVTVE